MATKKDLENITRCFLEDDDKDYSAFMVLYMQMKEYEKENGLYKLSDTLEQLYPEIK